MLTHEDAVKAVAVVMCDLVTETVKLNTDLLLGTQETRGGEVASMILRHANDAVKALKRTEMAS